MSITYDKVLNHLEFYRPPVSSIPAKEYLRAGKYPIIDQGKSFIAGYTNNSSYVFEHPEPVIVFGDHTRIWKYIDFPFAIGADGTKILRRRANSIILVKYAYYFLYQYDLANDGYGRHSKHLKSISMGIPSSISQNRIINQLDSLSNCVDQISCKAQIQSEALSALEPSILRGVFSWKNDELLPTGWEWKKLRDISIINPQRPNNIIYDESVSFLPMDAIDEVTGSIDYLLSKPSEEARKGYTYFQNGDILFAKITPCMQNGKCCIVKELHNGYGFGSTEFVVIRPDKDIYSKWIFYFLRTSEFRKYAEDHFSGSAGQQRVPIDLIENALIPVPIDVSQLLPIANLLDVRTSVCHKLISIMKKQMQVLNHLDLSVIREKYLQSFEDEYVNQ